MSKGIKQISEEMAKRSERHELKEPLQEKPLSDDLKRWKCTFCENKTEHHGIPYTACESCQKIIEKFIKITKFSGQVFRDAVERQKNEQFKALLEKRIKELEEATQDYENPFECCIEELKKLKEMIK